MGQTMEWISVGAGWRGHRSTVGEGEREVCRSWRREKDLLMSKGHKQFPKTFIYKHVQIRD